jgi:hypothetical protein
LCPGQVGDELADIREGGVARLDRLGIGALVGRNLLVVPNDDDAIGGDTVVQLKSVGAVDETPRERGQSALDRVSASTAVRLGTSSARHNDGGDHSSSSNSQLTDTHMNIEHANLGRGSHDTSSKRREEDDLGEHGGRGLRANGTLDCGDRAHLNLY